ncbi:hypothetical protein AVEN_41023-1 [Araneus ventricosus]|uniref:Uncharacterized protein n=1 Tax=Araneus ventricosus TaxID=182803 RepID=A0A4Y2CIL9_ARAVE|nr:hypothetical protein AVEN_41023-1 [Araneus ventricosus]
MTATALSRALSSPAFQLALSKVITSFGCLRLYTIARLVVTSHGIIQYILHISSRNRDIEKMIAFLEIVDLSPKSPNLSPLLQNSRQSQGYRPDRCR